MIWDTKRKLCKIVEVTVPLDTNLAKAYKDKETKYIKLISSMQQQHRGYKFSVVVITVGRMGTLPRNLELNLKKLELKADRTNTVIERIQKAALLGKVKICKTVMNM